MIGIGLDLCEIARMERLLEKNDSFLRKYFTPSEQAYILGRGKVAAQSMAGIFAAKEALLKALGTGLGALPLTDISVEHGETGKPFYALTDMAAETFEALGATRALLSVTHEAGVAAAVAVIE